MSKRLSVEEKRRRFKRELIDRANKRLKSIFDRTEKRCVDRGVDYKKTLRVAIPLLSALKESFRIAGVTSESSDEFRGLLEEAFNHFNRIARASLSFSTYGAKRQRELFGDDSEVIVLALDDEERSESKDESRRVGYGEGYVG